MLKVRDSGGTLRTIIAMKVRDASNVLQTVAVGAMRDATNVVRIFLNSLSLALSTDTVFGSINTNRTVAIQTQAVTVTPDGGAAPYSYLWAITGSSGGTWSIAAAASGTTAFTGGNCGPGDSFTATFHCTVTDAAGNVAVTGTVTAAVSNIGYSVSGGGGPLP